MERLNDIMMRSTRSAPPTPHAPRTSRNTEQRPTDADGARPVDPRSRRPLPEQTGQTGQAGQTEQESQRHAPVSQPQSPQSFQSPQSQPTYKRRGYQHTLPPRVRPDQSSRYSQGQRTIPPQRQQQQAQPPQPPFEPERRRGEPDSRTAAYYEHYERPHERLRYAQPEPPSQRRGDYRDYDERGEYNEYYESYPPRREADVQEEWDDDAVMGIRTGDWEDVESEGVAYLQPPSQVRVEEIPPHSTHHRPDYANYPTQTRKLAADPARDGEARSSVTRDLRTARNGQPVPERQPQQSHQSQQYQPPVPPTPVQESRPYRRQTQPLNSRTISEITQEVIPAPSRQVVVRASSSVYVPQVAAVPCPLCKGAGYLRADVPFGHPNFGRPIPCKCKENERKEKRRLQLEEMSNLGAFRSKGFKNFNPNVSEPVKRAFHVAYQYAQDPDGWLVLIGKNGCGKTHLAAAIANQRLVSGSLVLFTTVPELLDHLRATFAPNSTTVYDQQFSSMREAELLVMDDLGAQQSSPWANEKLFQLLNYRYNSRFPTIITTNNMGLQNVDERLRSRLTDASLVTTLTFDGAFDYRPRNPRRE